MNALSGDSPVHIWAPDAGQHPQAHADMQALQQHQAALSTLMRKHGIERADFTPPLPSGTFDPAKHDDDLQYYLILERPVTREQSGEIRDAIQDLTGIFGTSLKPFTPQARIGLIKEHGLVELQEHVVSKQAFRQ